MISQFVTLVAKYLPYIWAVFIHAFETTSMAYVSQFSKMTPLVSVFVIPFSITTGFSLSKASHYEYRTVWNLNLSYQRLKSNSFINFSGTVFSDFVFFVPIWFSPFSLELILISGVEFLLKIHQNLIS